MTIGPKIWFITGISRGFGRALVEALVARGDTVIGTTRSGSADITRGKGRLDVLALEVTEPQAVKKTMSAAFQLHGRIDVIVNNAGCGLLSSIEEATEEEVEHVFAVNFHSTRRVIVSGGENPRESGGGRKVGTKFASATPRHRLTNALRLGGGLVLPLRHGEHENSRGAGTDEVGSNLPEWHADRSNPWDFHAPTSAGEKSCFRSAAASQDAE